MSFVKPLTRLLSTWNDFGVKSTNVTNQRDLVKASQAKEEKLDDALACLLWHVKTLTFLSNLFHIYGKPENL